MAYYEIKDTFIFCSSLAIRFRKLSTVTEPGIKPSLLIGQYGAGLWSYALMTRALKLKVIEDVPLQLTINNNRTEIMSKYQRNLSYNVSAFHQMISRIVKLNLPNNWILNQLTKSQSIKRFVMHSILHLRHSNEPFLDRIGTWWEMDPLW